jgi:hypothetical protein
MNESISYNADPRTAEERTSTCREKRGGNSKVDMLVTAQRTLRQGELVSAMRWLLTKTCTH